MIERARGAAVGAFAALIGAAGCVTQQQFLDQHQAMAMQTAVSRGQFELNCPAATGIVISREVVQPALQATGPFLGGVQGVQRAEYTIGVEGCGERKTFVVLCPEGGGGCFAAGPGPFHRY
jgi:hypothetical protein